MHLLRQTAGLWLTTAAAVVAAEPIGWHAAGKGGAVAAGDARAVAAGIGLLRAGGNAADAAVATLFALAITDYGRFAIGGEIPLLIYDAERGEVKVLCGLGRAPLDPAAIAWFYAEGIPSQGSMRAAPVPGAIDLCVTTLRLYGTRSLSEVLAPTFEILDEHAAPWHADLAATLRLMVEAEQQTNGTRTEKLVAARDRFYRGDIAESLVAWYRETGSFLRLRDLAAHTTTVGDPVTVDYRGYRIHKCGPWTQGPALCQALRLLEGFDLQQMGRLSADYVHVATESLKLAFADRDTYYGDPAFVGVPIRSLLSEAYSRHRRSLIDLTAASLERRPGNPHQPGRGPAATSLPPPADDVPVSDTTTCVVADRWGNLVSATPSCNLVGNVPGPQGVTQGNRLRSLNTTPQHPNRIEPGKRPRITLTPTLVTRHGRAVAAISVAGGDLQDQTTLNVLLNHVEFGLAPAEAVTTPRFATSHHENSFDPNPNRAAALGTLGELVLNETVPAAVRENLARRGHRIRTVNGPIAHPVMLVVDPATRLIQAAGDPAAERHAAAID